MKKCPDCGSEKIIKNAMALDRGDSNSNHLLRVAIDEKPDAVFFKHRIYSDVKVDICAECGHIKFYAVDPKTLWIAYQNREKNL